jgi:glycine/D-amino acid oxidase-like deaminating enzyme/F0F1-type ATP synthase membrane subunit c/vacuolar-type H+-ATPase subunit K
MAPKSNDRNVVTPPKEPRQHGVKVRKSRYSYSDITLGSHQEIRNREFDYTEWALQNDNAQRSTLTLCLSFKKGVYYGGDWLDIEDCDGTFSNLKDCSGCSVEGTCPRSRSRNTASKPDGSFDVVIVGAGCIGAAIARELSKYNLSILWVEAADDVSQGATKGNSGIVHAGYDDVPGTNHAKYCWKGNQMFAQLDRELRFGYQTNGSLVLAFDEKEHRHLSELKKRGETNGVERLRIIDQKELVEMEPYVHPDAIAALYSPDAGNVIPYEFTIALAENAVDNGVELRIRRHVTDLDYHNETGDWTITLRHWEPQQYLHASKQLSPTRVIMLATITLSCLVSAGMGLQLVLDDAVDSTTRQYSAMATYTVILIIALVVFRHLNSNNSVSRTTPLAKIVEQASPPVGKGGHKVQVDDMLVGGSGSSTAVDGVTVATEEITAKYVINCAGGAADQIARMIGDDSFAIKPRLGDYLLLNRNQVCSQAAYCISFSADDANQVNSSRCTYI